MQKKNGKAIIKQRESEMADRPVRQVRRSKKQSTDIVLKNFWCQDAYFADLINAVVFAGRQVIRAEMLTEMDTDVSGTITMSNYGETIKRTRDVVKKMALGMEFVVCGIENQQNTHYAMPLRMMLYDALGYLKEYREAVQQEKNAEKKGESSRRTARSEFLSGITKKQRFHPQISIILYYGEEKWDGPQTLKDMMIDMPSEIEQVFSDYRMNLVQVTEADRYRFRNEDVQTVLGITSAILRGDFESVRQKYDREISAELAGVIGAITGSELLQEYAKKGENVNMTTLNMCSSLKRLEQEGYNRGMEEGIERGTIKKLFSQMQKQKLQGKSAEEIRKIFTGDLGEEEEVVDEILAELERVCPTAQQAVDELSGWQVK